MRAAIRIGVIAASFTLISGASALALPGEINVTSPGGVFGSPAWKQTVTVDHSGESGPVRVNAGLFRLQSDAAGTILEDFDAFCIDFLGRINNTVPGKYLVNEDVFAGGDGGSGATRTRVAGFWNAFYGEVADERTAAAFQIGLWEAKYDASFSLSEGVFKVTDADSQTLKLADDWLGTLDTMLGDGSANTASNFLALKADPASGQDLLTAVPLPAAAWLLLGGLGSFGLLRRRRRALA